MRKVYIVEHSHLLGTDLAAFESYQTALNRASAIIRDGGLDKFDPAEEFADESDEWLVEHWDEVTEGQEYIEITPLDVETDEE